jgi:hypothetical protein
MQVILQCPRDSGGEASWRASMNYLEVGCVLGVCLESSKQMGWGPWAYGGAGCEGGGRGKLLL